MQVFSVHLECANADSHIHILDEPPAFLCEAHVLGNVATVSLLLYLSSAIPTWISGKVLLSWVDWKNILEVCGACSHERTCVGALLCVWGGGVVVCV